MTRGNQREIDRARAQARAAKHAGGGKDDGLTPQQRNERDKAAMLEKQAKKQAAKAAGEVKDKKGAPKPGTVDGPGKKKKKSHFLDFRDSNSTTSESPYPRS